MKHYILIGTSLILSACAASKIYPINQDLYKAHISKSFQFSKEDCFSATKQALMERGYKIKYENINEGKLVSSRRYYDVNASVTMVSAGGTNSSSSHFVSKQSNQYYFNINGHSSSCKIIAFRWRAWNGEEEMLEIQEEGLEWAKKNLFKPFYAEVERFLKNKPY